MIFDKLERIVGSVLLAGALALSSGCYSLKDLQAYHCVEEKYGKTAINAFITRWNNEQCVRLPEERQMTNKEKWGSIGIDNQWIGRELRTIRAFREALPQDILLNINPAFDDFEIPAENNNHDKIQAKTD